MTEEIELIKTMLGTQNPAEADRAEIEFYKKVKKEELWTLIFDKSYSIVIRGQAARLFFANNKLYKKKDLLKLINEVEERCPPFVKNGVFFGLIEIDYFNDFIVMQKIINDSNIVITDEIKEIVEDLRDEYEKDDR